MQVHRVGNAVAVWLGPGSDTMYLTSEQARLIGLALGCVSQDINFNKDASKSVVGTFTIGGSASYENAN